MPRAPRSVLMASPDEMADHMGPMRVLARRGAGPRRSAAEPP